MTSITPALQLLNHLKKIEGRKRFHKLAYILKFFRQAPFQERFEYVLFGVYSYELQEELSDLAKTELLKEEHNPDTKRYTFTSTPQLDSYLANIQEAGNQSWFGLADELNTYDTRHLEGISTVLFLQGSMPELFAPSPRDDLHRLKSHLDDIADDCIRVANALRNKYGQ